MCNNNIIDINNNSINIINNINNVCNNNEILLILLLMCNVYY